MDSDPNRRLILGAAGAMVIGGNPAMRPDQALPTLTRAGTGPAPQTNIFSRLIVAGGSGFVGVFLYSPTPGAGNLVASSAPANGTDPYGNAYLAGQVSYAPNPFSLNYAVAINSNQLQFFTAPAASNGAGPWTLAGNMLLDGTGTQLIFNTPSNGLQVIGGVTNIQNALHIQSGAGVAVQQNTTDVAGTTAIGVKVSADTFNRWQIFGSGFMNWGSGSAGPDVSLARGAANLLNLGTADFGVTATGRGLRVAEGANGKQGRTAAMTAGTITVANTSVTANSEIICTGQVLGGTAGGVNISARTAGTSFTITSTSATDTSTVGFLMMEPG